MDELQAILGAWRRLESGVDGVLATVVHVTGSAYRRPGARMLILPGGRRIGSISGGCLEGEITAKAWWYTESGAPALRVYDTTSDEDAVWEFGLGCNGVVQVMLERIYSGPVREMLEFLDVRRRADESAVVATVIRSNSLAQQPGDRLLIDKNGVRGGTLSALDWVRSHAAVVHRERKSRVVRREDVEVFIEYIPRPQSLVVFGAGHDAVPVAAFATQLGWRVTVADGRPAYARPERFPGVDRVVLMPPGDPLRDVAIDSETAVVVMTHNYPLDARILPRIMMFRPRYLGLLGPKRRTERLFHELGMKAPVYVHSPVGLDLGGDEPSAVALSIVAEVQAAISHRDGRMLRDRREPIHAAVPEFGDRGGESFEAVQPTWCETMVGYNA